LGCSKSKLQKQFYLCCLIVFFTRLPSAIADNTVNNPLIRLDHQLFDTIYDADHIGTGPHQLVTGITHFGDPKAVMAISALLMAYGSPEQKETGKLLTTSFALSGLSAWGAKQIINRRRPLDKLEQDTPAFPSGHTTLAFATATIFSDSYPKLKIPFYCGAGLVAFSRIYLGRHYPLDTLAGSVVGTVSAHIVLKYRRPVLGWEF
jgi:undecaprenyl-diphosphatase